MVHHKGYGRRQWNTVRRYKIKPNDDTPEPFQNIFQHFSTRYHEGEDRKKASIQMCTNGQKCHAGRKD